MSFFHSLFRFRFPKKFQMGFSLLEIIIVIAIIGVLIGIIVNRITTTRESAYVGLTSTRAANLYSKILQYQIATNNYPKDLKTLTETVPPTATADELNDAWGRTFCYAQPSPGGVVLLGSRGPKAEATPQFCYADGNKLDTADNCSGLTCAP